MGLNQAGKQPTRGPWIKIKKANTTARRCFEVTDTIKWQTPCHFEVKDQNQVGIYLHYRLRFVVIDQNQVDPCQRLRFQGRTPH